MGIAFSSNKEENKRFFESLVFDYKISENSQAWDGERVSGSQTDGLKKQL
jgi:hypothetical protein